MHLEHARNICLSSSIFRGTIQCQRQHHAACQDTASEWVQQNIGHCFGFPRTVFLGHLQMCWLHRICKNSFWDHPQIGWLHRISKNSFSGSPTNGPTASNIQEQFSGPSTNWLIASDIQEQFFGVTYEWAYCIGYPRTAFRVIYKLANCIGYPRTVFLGHLQMDWLHRILKSSFSGSSTNGLTASYIKEQFFWVICKWADCIGSAHAPGHEQADPELL